MKNKIFIICISFMVGVLIGCIFCINSGDKGKSEMPRVSFIRTGDRSDTIYKTGMVRKNPFEPTRISRGVIPDDNAAARIVMNMSVLSLVKIVP